MKHFYKHGITMVCAQSFFSCSKVIVKYVYGIQKYVMGMPKYSGSRLLPVVLASDSFPAAERPHLALGIRTTFSPFWICQVAPKTL